MNRLKTVFALDELACNKQKRKSLPLIFLLFLLYWVACRLLLKLCFISYYYERLVEFTHVWGLYAVAGLVLLILAASFKLAPSRLRSTLQTLCLALCVLILSFMLVLSSVQEDFNLIKQVGNGDKLECVLRIVSDPHKSKFSNSVQAEVIELDSRYHQRSLNYRFLEQRQLKLRLGAQLPALYRGELMSAQLDMRPLKLEDERDRQLFFQGNIASAKLDSYHSLGFGKGYLAVIFSFRAELLELLNPALSPSRAFLSAILMGYTSDLESFYLREDFARTGLSHLVAVSGSHLAVTLLFMQIILRYLRLPKFPELLFLLLISFSYLALSGFQISAVRAWIMAVCALSAGFFRRSPVSLSALGVAGFVLISLSVRTAVSLSFTLSVLSVIGITIFSPYIDEFIRLNLPQGLSRYKLSSAISSAISLSLISQFICLPISLPLFSYFSLSSPFINILMGMVVSLALCSGFLWIALHFIFPVLARYLLECMDTLLAYILQGVHVISTNNYLVSSLHAGELSLALGVFGSLLLLWIFWPQPQAKSTRLFTGFLVVGLCYMCLYGSKLQVACIALDIGQGDAIYLQDHNHNLLVDTGEDAKILKALARMQVKKLEGVLLTHLDKDHVGGMTFLAAYVKVDRIYLAKGVKENLPSELREAFKQAGVKELVELSAKDRLSVGKFHAEVLWPQQEVDGNENKDSLVLLMRYQEKTERYPRGFSLLLTGDAESEVNQILIDQRRVNSIDLLKVGHHGARVCLNEKQAAIFSPDFALISCGAYNRYGHPHQQVLNALSKSHTQILRTDQQGDVGVYLKAGEWTAYQQK